MYTIKKPLQSTFQFFKVHQHPNAHQHILADLKLYCIIVCPKLYLQEMQQIGEAFFERQSFFSLLCGMHSVNNLLANHAYTKQDMNQICYKLSDSFINPHKHIFGGDYDANVLIVALQNHQCTIKWHDRRKQFSIREQISEEGQSLQLIGFIINKYQGGGLLSKIFRISPRHWIAMRREGDNYRYLDSNADSPRLFGRRQAEQHIVQLLGDNNEPEETTQVIEVYKVQ